MADLYGATAPASDAVIAPHDPDDISSFLHHLLNNSSSSSSSGKRMHSVSTAQPRSSPLLPSPEKVKYQHRLGQGGRSSSGFNFSDPNGYFPADGKEGNGNAFSPLGVVELEGTVSARRSGFSAEDDFGDFSCDSEGGASEVALNPTVKRASSKRTRAAEFHNLSEKMRRSRINEKMKALQNLIPNSNKTDKASMLDEAIEYLKQLQSQVQMLSMRSGISLHPMCLPVLQPMHLPQMGTGFDEGNGLMNANREAGMFLGNLETSMQTAFATAPSNQKNDIPSLTNMHNLEIPFGFEPSIQGHVGHFNLSQSSKENPVEATLPPQQLHRNDPENSSGAS